MGNHVTGSSDDVRARASGMFVDGRAMISLAVALSGALGCHASGPATPAARAEPSVEAPQTAATAPTEPTPDPGARTAEQAEPSAKAGGASFGFDQDATDATPSGFAFGRTGGGPAGRWVVQADATAPSKPNVLAQLDADDASFRFPVAVAAEPSLTDVRVSVRCKMLRGEVDQACGLVARYRDADNYFVTRANALEDNIRLYTVHEGRRHELASYDGAVTPQVWHEYRFELTGDRLQVFWDGKRVLDHRDDTFTGAGQTGLWTKADSVTYFDDFRVEQP